MAAINMARSPMRWQQRLRPAAELWRLCQVQSKQTGRQAIVACVQDHHVVDAVGKNRLHTIVPELVVEGVLEEYKKKPSLGTRKILALSMFNERTYLPGQESVMAKWGMAIDLTTLHRLLRLRCCVPGGKQYPVVGKEMSIAAARCTGFASTATSNGARTQRKIFPKKAIRRSSISQSSACTAKTPRARKSGPVAATTHSHEGLNMMTYKPLHRHAVLLQQLPFIKFAASTSSTSMRRYHGRQGNLYTPNLLRDDLNELVKMQKNPQVTVRSPRRHGKMHVLASSVSRPASGILLAGWTHIHRRRLVVQPSMR